MGEYYSRRGRPITMETWAQKFSDTEYKRVAETTVDGAYVSTVWLGLNHQYGDGPPLIFETMIFGGDHDDYCDRYSTEAEAIAGHDQCVAMVKEGSRS